MFSLPWALDWRMPSSWARKAVFTLTIGWVTGLRCIQTLLCGKRCWCRAPAQQLAFIVPELSKPGLQGQLFYNWIDHLIEEPEPENFLHRMSELSLLLVPQPEVTRQSLVGRMSLSAMPSSFKARGSIASPRPQHNNNSPLSMHRVGAFFGSRSRSMSSVSEYSMNANAPTEIVSPLQQAVSIELSPEHSVV